MHRDSNGVVVMFRKHLSLYDDSDGDSIDPEVGI